MYGIVWYHSHSSRRCNSSFRCVAHTKLLKSLFELIIDISSKLQREVLTVCTLNHSSCARSSFRCVHKQIVIELKCMGSYFSNSYWVCIFASQRRGTTSLKIIPFEMKPGYYYEWHISEWTNRRANASHKFHAMIIFSSFKIYSRNNASTWDNERKIRFQRNILRLESSALQSIKLIVFCFSAPIFLLPTFFLLLFLSLLSLIYVCEAKRTKRIDYRQSLIAQKQINRFKSHSFAWFRVELIHD